MIETLGDNSREFNSYRNIENPPKFMDKINHEFLLFTLQSKMKANGKEPFTPLYLTYNESCNVQGDY